MITIIEGMTPTEYISALNNNFPSKDVISSIMLSGDLVTYFNSNYDYVRSIDSEIVAKSTLSVGQSASTFIARLNQNFQNINNVSPYKEYDYTIPSQRGSEYGCLMDSLYSPVAIKLASGNQLIGGISRGGVMSRENFCVIKEGGVYSNPYLMGFEASTEGTYDTHSKASFIEKEGIIYAFHEILVGVSATNAGGHGSPVVVKKSLDGGETWSEVSRFGIYLSYAKVHLINGDFYAISRELISSKPKYVAIYKSTDDCETWTKLTTPYVSDDGYWSYHSIPLGDYNEINLIITERYFLADHSTWPYVGHIRSTDGITYYNSDRSWSKNVVNDGNVTRTELLTNCLVVPYTVEERIVSYNGGFIKNDKLYSLISLGIPYTTTGWATGLINMIFSGLKIYEDSTELVDISNLISGAEWIGYGPGSLFLNFMRKGEGFDVLVFDSLSNNDIKLINCNTSAIVSTKLLRIGDASSVAIQMGTFSSNTTDRTNRLIVVGKITGNMLDLVDSYTDWVIFEPNT